MPLVSSGTQVHHLERPPPAAEPRRVRDLRRQRLGRSLEVVCALLRARASLFPQVTLLPLNPSDALSDVCSSYPEKRVEKGEDGEPEGRVGSVGLVQQTALSTQPVHSFDWSPDKLGLAVAAAFDQSVRVLIATRLNTL